MAGMEFKPLVSLEIYTGEDIICEGRPLYKAIVLKALDEGLAGATVIKGIEGYASTRRGFTARASKFISGNADYPVIVKITDTRENIEKILPFLEKNVDHGLVLINETHCLITDYIRKKEAEKAKQAEGEK